MAGCGDRGDGQPGDFEALPVGDVIGFGSVPVLNERSEHRRELRVERRRRRVQTVTVGSAEVDGHIPTCKYIGQAQNMVGVTVGEEDRLRLQSLLAQQLLKPRGTVVSGVDENAVAASCSAYRVAVDVEEFGVGREHIHVQSLSTRAPMVMLG